MDNKQGSAQFPQHSWQNQPQQSQGQPYPQQQFPPQSNSMATPTQQLGDYHSNTGMLKLNHDVKIVRIPVAGQPGQYKTGILPVQPNTRHNPTMPLPPQKQTSKRKIIVFATLILLILLSSGLYFLTRPATEVTKNPTPKPTGQAQNQFRHATATAQIYATATAENNVIFHDPLTTQSNGWLFKPQGDHGRIYEFKNGAYHIRQAEAQYLAQAVHETLIPPTQFTYSLTVQVISTDDTDEAYAGLVLRYTSKDDKPSFYFFRIKKTEDVFSYEFIKFKGSEPEDKIYTNLFKKDTGKEFKSVKEKNTIKIRVDGKKFTFFVNGKEIGKAEDGEFMQGSIGMLVNKKGTEAAFTEFLVTHT